jgi:hypothetical protein
MASNQVTLDMNELRSMVREMVLEVLSDLTETDDPDAGLSFKPEIAEYLRRYRQERPKGTPLEDVIKDLGLDV